MRWSSKEQPGLARLPVEISIEFKPKWFFGRWVLKSIMISWESQGLGPQLHEHWYWSFE